VLLILVFGVWSVCAAAVLTEGEAVNRAGQQRMLSQRMAKSWALLAQHSMFAVQKEQLVQSMHRFEDNLQQLQTYSAQHEGVLQQPLTVLVQQWDGYRQVLLSEPSMAQIPALLAQSEQTLQKAELLVKQMMAQSHDGGLAEVVAVSGRQRMLSQRIAWLYAVSSSATDQVQARQQAIAGFGQALLRLQKYAGNTPQTRQVLREVSIRWNFAQHIFAQPKPLFRVLDTTCEQLLTQMDQATTLYAALKHPVPLSQ
jgi:hypothetical protein